MLSTKRGTTRLRDPERTRQRLLQAAFREVYVSGFQSARLKAILAASGVTKGTLYYYFKSAEALEYAIVEEIIDPTSEPRGYVLCRVVRNLSTP
jgi:TetR/AcrR family transcriptional regulator, transcriptional repressor for nem operon